jgi:hypothetical protein
MAEINAQGMPFSHMQVMDLDITQPTVQISEETCSTGTGCSLKVKASDVKRWYVVEDGQATPAKWADLVEQAETTGLKPRDLELYLGALVKPPKRMAVYMYAELAYIRLRRIQDRKERWQAERKIPRATKPSGWPDSLLRVACLKGANCSEWSTSERQAESDSKMSSSNGKNAFSVMFKAHTKGAAPEHVARPETFTLDMVLVYDPETRLWEQLFNTFMGTAPKLRMDDRSIPQPV